MIEVWQAGKFANEGERRVVAELRRRLPPNAIIIANLFLPVKRDTLEIDVVVVSALGIFLVEVKDWAGTVEFTRGSCLVRGETRKDPRDSISMKAKMLHGYVKNVVTAPVLVMANSTVLVKGNLHESVPVLSCEEAATAIAAGRIGSWKQKVPLSAREIRSAAQLLHSRHSANHRPQMGGYLVGEPIDSPFEEYWGVEVADPDYRVRLKRHLVDAVAAPSERDEHRVIARRSVTALRKLQKLHSEVLPQVYACFDDPDDDTSIWTAYEAVEGVKFLDAPMDARTRLRALADVADALGRCHENGVLHRALNAECLIVPEGGTVPKLLHFDFARIEGAQTLAAERVRQAVVHLSAIAPEVRHSPSAASAASDVYSLGHIAAEALSGARFKKASEATGAAARLRPRAMSDLILKMLHDEPRARPTMAQVVEVFRRGA